MCGYVCVAVGYGISNDGAGDTWDAAESWVASVCPRERGGSARPSERGVCGVTDMDALVPSERERPMRRRFVRAWLSGGGMEGCRDAGMQGCRDAGMQGCREWRNAGEEE
jgi:hypothetical protein